MYRVVSDEGYEATYQMCFKKGKEAYHSAINYINQLADIFADSDVQIDSEALVQEFDMGLQYILLCTALQDDFISEMECRYINDITDYIDIFDSLYFINATQKVSWNSLSTVSIEKVRDYCEMISTVSSLPFINFISTLSTLDAANNNTIVRDTLLEMIAHISSQLLCIDGTLIGEGTIQYKQQGALILAQVFIAPWNEIISVYDKDV